MLAHRMAGGAGYRGQPCACGDAGGVRPAYRGRGAGHHAGPAGDSGGLPGGQDRLYRRIRGRAYVCGTAAHSPHRRCGQKAAYRAQPQRSVQCGYEAVCQTAGKVHRFTD